MNYLPAQDEAGTGRDGAPSASTEIMPRATVARIVHDRNVALQRYEEAHRALVAAQAAITAANAAVAKASPGITSYNHHNDRREKNFLCKLEVEEAEKFKKAARNIVDTNCWAYIVQITDLESLMDKKAKDQLRSQLMDEPPEITAGNIFATLDTFRRDADMIFRRGVAECFSNLDRRFRSHTGWKIGSRVILSRAFDDMGWWSFYSNHRDTLIDIERAFFVLDGLPVPPTYYGVVQAVDNARRTGWGARQTEVETEFFLLRIYKNGNCHVWFKRDDLLVKVNKLLAEYYGEVIPEEREPHDDGDLFTPKTSLAKNFGFFPTPPDLAATIVSKANLWHEKGQTLSVLEPSAGTGNLARLAAAKDGVTVDCVEIQADLARALDASGIYRRVTHADFLTLRPNPSALYDRVIMNPPFDRERDIDHVIHALEFLKPDGFLIAIMSAGTEFRETRKSIAFREMMAKLRAGWHDLPAGSFAEVGTYINTLALCVWKDGTRVERWHW